MAGAGATGAGAAAATVGGGTGDATCWPALGKRSVASLAMIFDTGDGEAASGVALVGLASELASAAAAAGLPSAEVRILARASRRADPSPPRDDDGGRGDAAALDLLRLSSIDASSALSEPARMLAACAASASAYSSAPSTGSYLRSTPPSPLIVSSCRMSSRSSQPAPTVDACCASNGLPAMASMVELLPAPPTPRTISRAWRQRTPCPLRMACSSTERALRASAEPSAAAPSDTSTAAPLQPGRRKAAPHCSSLSSAEPPHASLVGKSSPVANFGESSLVADGFDRPEKDSGWPPLAKNAFTAALPLYFWA